MMARNLKWLVVLFFAIIVALVFQQIHTSMTEQGIASGGPYDNAAAYPRAIAVIIAVLLLLQTGIEGLRGAAEPVALEADALRRAVGLLLVFSLYLMLLGWLGYHLTTTPMVFAIMWLCGGRQIVRMVTAALSMSFVFAFIFEKFLNVVLPGGVFRLNIPW